MSKNVLLLFAKLPEPGMAKTRLSVLKDGFFSPEDAAELFGCMLLDVVEICLGAFEQMKSKATESDRTAKTDGVAIKDEVAGIDGVDAIDGNAHRNGVAGIGKTASQDAETYELVISTAPAENATAMREFIAAEFGEGSVELSDGSASETQPAKPIRVITDSGHSFDEHYNDAFEQVWAMDADSILSMGADMPALTADDIVRGFDALYELEAQGRRGIVLAPDQEMGVSIVGWNRDTAFNTDQSGEQASDCNATPGSDHGFDHTGVYYNPTGLTVLPAYIEKAREAGIDVVWLPPVPDVDTMSDLAHNLTLIDALAYCSECVDRNGAMFSWAHRTHKKLEDLGVAMVRIPPNELRDPRDLIDG